MPAPDGSGPDAPGTGVTGSGSPDTSTAAAHGAPAVVTPPAADGAASVAIRHDGDVCRVSGTIDFSTARETLEAVAPLVERGAIRQVDLGGVTRSNSAGLALMVEWLGVARRAGHPLEFTAVPDGLRQLAGVCQVEALIA